MRRDDVRRLAEQEASLHADLLELNGTAEKENRNLSAEEQEKFDKMMADVGEIRERRSRAEQLLVQDREVQRTLTTPVEQRVAGAGEPGATSLAEYRRRNGYQPVEETPEHMDAFWHHLTANDHELDVEEKRALSKGTTTAGGFLVPTSMSNEIIRASRDMGAIATLANEIRTAGGETLNLPANTVHGVASWTAEAGAYTPSDETFANVALGAYKSTLVLRGTAPNGGSVDARADGGRHSGRPPRARIDQKSAASPASMSSPNRTHRSVPPSCVRCWTDRRKGVTASSAVAGTR